MEHSSEGGTATTQMKFFRPFIMHLIVVVAVILIVKNRPGRVANDTTSQQSDESASRAMNASSSSRDEKNRMAQRNWSALDYANAWKQLPGQKLSKSERINAQRMILRGWAERDLEAALRAAFADNAQGVSMVNNGTDQLREIFGDVILERTEDFWQLIQSNKLGLINSALLGQVWVHQLANADPQLLKPYLVDITPKMFAMALRYQAANGKSTMSGVEMLAVLESRAASVPDRVEDHLVTLTLMEKLGFNDALAALSKASPHVQGVLISTMAANILKSDSQNFSTEVAKLPADQRALFAAKVLDFTSIGGDKVEEIQTKKDSIEYLVAEQNWKLLEGKGAEDAVRSMASVTDPQALAEWSYTLPPRKETTEMFHRGVETYMRKSPEQAWQWVQDLPSGYWKDRALAEFSQQSLHHHKNPEWSRNAIDQIADPSYRQIVEGWRSDWESKK